MSCNVSDSADHESVYVDITSIDETKGYKIQKVGVYTTGSGTNLKLWVRILIDDNPNHTYTPNDTANCTVDNTSTPPDNAFWWQIWDGTTHLKTRKALITQTGASNHATVQQNTTQ
jgi:hypothetical protein